MKSGKKNPLRLFYNEEYYPRVLSRLKLFNALMSKRDLKKVLLAFLKTPGQNKSYYFCHLVTSCKAWATLYKALGHFMQGLGLVQFSSELLKGLDHRAQGKLDRVS